MALHINLYHEIQRTRKQEQYDPLKISFVCLLVVALGLTGWYFAKLNETSDIRAAHAANKAAIANLEPEAAKAKLEEEALSKQVLLADTFTKRIEDRFYWAPLMELISHTIPKNVQVTKLIGDIGPVDPVTPRRVGISIDGISAGDQPRKVAEDLRLALIDTFGRKFKGVTASFRTLDDSIERIHLDGANLNTAVFSITINFNATAPDSAEPQHKTALR